MKPKIYMIGNAHLDPVWLWTKLEGCAEVLSTFESAARRIEEEDKFIFTCSSARYYEFVKAQNPGLFAKIKKYVKAGKWCIAGGQWVQPDNNLPSGEVFARHALYSQNFFLENFGVACETGYCVDSFGQNGNLPQLLRQSRMENYVFMRPGDSENPDVPNLFVWKGIDGSEVLTFRIFDAYNSGNDDEILLAQIQKIEEYAKEKNHGAMCFFGVGNHGGGPTRKTIALINSLMKEGRNLEYASPDGYFNDIRKQNLRLPVWNTDLQMHAIGCYSVAGGIKRLARECERELIKAEKYNLLAGRLTGAAPENGEIKRAYANMMFNSFHDIMCGCCIKDGLDAAKSDYSESLSIAARIKEKAMLDIAGNIDTMIDGATLQGKTDWQIWEENDNGVPVVIFNPHGYDVRKQIKIDRVYKTVCGADGKPVELQYAAGRYKNGPDTQATVFEAAVPPLGYAVYWIYQNRELNKTRSANIGNGLTLENEYLKVSFDKKSGGVKAFIDKRTGKNLLKGVSFAPKIMGDSSDTWAHGLPGFDYSGLKNLKLEQISALENGGLLASVTARYATGASSVVQTFTLRKGAKQLDVSVKMIIREQACIIRLEGDFDMESPKLAHEIPYGTIVKRADGKENCAQRFACVYNGLSGAGIVTDCKSSFSADGGKLGFIAARNSVYGNHYGKDYDDGAAYDYTDEGLSYFNYSVLPTADFETLTRAADTADGLDYLIDSYHGGALKRSYSAVKIGAENVILSAVKKSEDKKCDILRFYECGGKPAKTVVKYFGKEIKLDFKPYQIRTVKFFEDGGAEDTDFCE